MNSLATPTTGHYEFRDERGETLGIKAAADGAAFMIVPDTILRFSNETAPAMALAILEAAGYALGTDRRGFAGAHELADTAAGMLNDAVRIADKMAAK